jgi:ribonuclease VapC
MTMMVDASALVAIMRSEPEGPDLASRLAADDRPFTNAIALWEATRAIARGSARRLDDSLEEVERYCAALGIGIAPITAADATQSVLAQQRYGKGTGHPARLNMGDCFAYACAKTNEARLLYKGDDFIHTDLG